MLNVQIETPAKTTRRILSSEFEPGMILHFHGARFRLRDDVKRHAPRAELYGSNDRTPSQDFLPCYTATGDYIDGSEVCGYFGPTMPWKFQGNDNATWTAEV